MFEQQDPVTEYSLDPLGLTWDEGEDGDGPIG